MGIEADTFRITWTLTKTMRRILTSVIQSSGRTAPAARAPRRMVNIITALTVAWPCIQEGGQSARSVGAAIGDTDQETSW